MKCCICGKQITGYGHNAAPLKEGKCCDKCQVKVVYQRLKKSEAEIMKK